MTAALSSSTEQPVSWALRFTLGEWDTRASVRTSRHDYRLPDDLPLQLETRYWFPPRFLPYLEHPAVQAAGRDVLHQLTANHLVHFLDYTTMLEHRIVNRAVETIVHGELPIHVPERMKTAALQLYTDEGYHALFSSQLAEQIADAYRIAPRPVIARRINRLTALIERTSVQNRPLAWFLIGFVSETLIARELLEVSRDSLVSCVSEMLRDHLSDEARHSRYFAEVFHYLWLTLNNRLRTFTARSLVEILGIFFEVDEVWLQYNLRAAGIEDRTVVEIVAGMATVESNRARARAGAVATLDALNKAGFFAVPINQKLFARAGLIDG